MGTGLFSPLLNGVYFGFSAGSDQLYVASDLGQNLPLIRSPGTATAEPNYTGSVIDALAYNNADALLYGFSPGNRLCVSHRPGYGR